MCKESVREDALVIARNILSGNNNCGTLKLAVESGNAQYFAAAAEPVLGVRHDEIAVLRRQFLAMSEQNNRLRFGLELLVQNLVPEPGKPVMTMAVTHEMKTAIEAVLGRAMPWDTG